MEINNIKDNSDYIIRKINLSNVVIPSKLVNFTKYFIPYKSEIIKQVNKDQTYNEPIDIEYIENQILNFLKKLGIKIPNISIGHKLTVLFEENSQRALGLLFFGLRKLYFSPDFYNLPTTKNGNLIIDYYNNDIEFKFSYNEGDITSFNDTLVKLNTLELVNTLNSNYIEANGGIEFLFYIQQNIFKIIDLVKHNPEIDFASLLYGENIKNLDINYFNILEDIYDFIIHYKREILKYKDILFVYNLFTYMMENLYNKTFSDFMKENNTFYLPKDIQYIKNGVYYFLENIRKGLNS